MASLVTPVQFSSVQFKSIFGDFSDFFCFVSDFTYEKQKNRDTIFFSPFFLLCCVFCSGQGDMFCSQPVADALSDRGCVKQRLVSKENGPLEGP